MLHHIVLMKFKPEIQDSEIVQLEKMLNELPNKIVEIHGYEFGQDVVHSDRSYDFALVSLFANLDALKRYQQHPEHVQVLNRIKRLCENVIAVDFETKPEATIEPDPIQRAFG